MAAPPGGPRTPTLSTVATAAGVSRQTVSNALNNPDLLRPDTLARVRSVIDELGYTPNRAARQLRTRTSHLVGLRVDGPGDTADNASMDRFLHALVDAMARTDHHLMLFSGDPHDPLDGYEDLLRSTAVDAFVVTDTYAGTPQAPFLHERGAPFVTFGRPWDLPAADWAWVDVDGAAGLRSATEHLLDAGHEQIAWLGWGRDSRLSEDRRSGWEAALAAAGRDPSGRTVRIDDDIDAARAAAHSQLDAGATAFACAGDTLGIGVLRALAERGLRPGTDVGVVGFEDSLAAQLTWPGLSSVRPPVEDVAAELVSLLHRVLAGDPPRDRGTMLAPSLVIRKSSLR